MIDVDEAQAIVLANVKTGDVETIDLGRSLGHTLAEAVCCDVDFPPFDRSVMDGFAVRAADVRRVPVTLRVAGRIAAGSTADRPLRPTEALQINTGAPIPPGADAVVRVESTEPSPDGGRVVIRESVAAGTFITKRAAHVRAGDVVLAAGTPMTAAAIGAAAAAGAVRVRAVRRPAVSIVVTGDELIDVAARPTGGQIRDSNGYLLAALVTAYGATAVPLGTVADDRAALHARLERGLTSDVLLVTGGISMGAFDFVPEVLSSCGARFHFRKVSIKPGRPTIFATATDGRPIFALPGNPASALVAFELFVRPALSVLSGGEAHAPRLLRATLRGPLDATRDRRTYRAARLFVAKDGGCEAVPLSWQGSGDPFGPATADGLIMRPPHAAAAADGEPVRVLPFRRGMPDGNRWPEVKTC